ncbi:trimethylamine methyltransferase family protein [Thiolinea disciformis]|uniref:trimethylamine methyltransferase family protein n=1 Tax=Thiolinea disciformis TaxID=125614 RepID=UPI00037C509E|nr:trimethylamine methyltransferase family protein [Thiolinea disciformis]
MNNAQALTDRHTRRRTRHTHRTETAPFSPYLKRKIPLYDLLSGDGVEAIEHHADIILQEFGIQFRGDEESIRLFVEAGAEAKGDIVHFPKGLIQQLIKTTPREFIHHARNPERSIVVGGDHVVFVPAYGSPFVSDLDRGRRYGTLEDFQNFIKLAYTSPYIHHSGGTICEPVDIPVNKRHLDMVYSHIRYSDKAYLGSITSPARADDSIELSKILFGETFMRDHCVVMGNINATSPLLFDGDVTRVIRTYAAAGQGIIVCPFVLGGAMGPVTPAGAIAQAHTESLVGIALAQLVRPGAPMIYGNFLTTMSLRNGSPTFGQPEASLAYFAIGQLARRAGVPLRCGGAFTSAKVSDFQAGQESADALTPALLSGANWVLHAAGWLEGGLTMGYEKFILDTNRLGMMARLLEGLALDDNAFALDSYRQRSSHNEHFLGTPHTLANYSDVFYESTTADSGSFEQWQAEGSQTAEQRANLIWKKQLEDYQAPALDPSIDEALQAFIREKKSAHPDSWY